MKIYESNEPGKTVYHLTILLGILGFIVFGLIPWGIFWPSTPAKNAATLATVHELKNALDSYRAGHGRYPFAPNYPQTFCAPVNQKACGRESNGAIVKLLLDQRYYHCTDVMLRQGSLADNFGRPLIIRILRENGKDGQPVERLFIWSYGRDGINGIDATPDYVNRGAPDYDTEEIRRIQNSPKDSDDIASWR